MTGRLVVVGGPLLQQAHDQTFGDLSDLPETYSAPAMDIAGRIDVVLSIGCHP